MPPVMKLPASEARSRARPRISFGSPIRPSGITAFHMSSLLAPVGVAPSAALAFPVLVFPVLVFPVRLALPRLVLNGPGAIALTRTPQRARSCAACLVKLTTAALAIAYEYGV